MAIEAKIAEYLKSEAGRDLIKESVGTVPPSLQAGEGTDNVSLLEKIEELKVAISSRILPVCDEDSTEEEKLVCALVELFDTLKACSFNRELSRVVDMKNAGELDAYEGEIQGIAKTLERQFGDLLKRIITDSKDPRVQLTALYDDIRNRIRSGIIN